MLAFSGLVGHVVEDLVTHDGGHRPPDLMVACNVDFVLALSYRKGSIRDIIKHKSISGITAGPNKMKMKRVGTGTSVKSPKMTASLSRIKAERGLSRMLSSPTRILEASAPLGIFFIK